MPLGRHVEVTEDLALAAAFGDEGDEFAWAPQRGRGTSAGRVSTTGARPIGGKTEVSTRRAPSTIPVWPRRTLEATTALCTTPSGGSIPPDERSEGRADNETDDGRVHFELGACEAGIL